MGNLIMLVHLNKRKNKERRAFCRIKPNNGSFTTIEF